MLVQTSCLRECEGHPKQRTSCEIFGMKGGFLLFFCFSQFLNCSYRCNIEEEYASRLAKLAKAPIGGDEIGHVLLFSNLISTAHFSI